MICQKCKKELNEKDKFCKYCGHKVLNIAQDTKGESMLLSSKGKEVKFFRTNIISGILCFISALAVLYMRSVYLEILRRESIEAGWMGLYDAPFSACIMVLFSTICFIMSVWYIYRAYLYKNSYMEIYTTHLEGDAIASYFPLSHGYIKFLYSDIQAVQYRDWYETNKIHIISAVLRPDNGKSVTGYVSITVSGNNFRFLCDDPKRAFKIIQEFLGNR